MAAWNVLVGIASVIGILSYTMLGCPDNERSVVINYSSRLVPKKNFNNINVFNLFFFLLIQF